MEAALAAALKAALSGGSFGGAIGGGAKFLLGHDVGGVARAATGEEIAKAAAKAAAFGGSVAGGSQLAGSALMGSPDDDEGGSPYAERGALGGGLLGGIGGGVLGGMLAAGKLGGPAMGELESKIAASVPDNVLLQYLKKLSAAPTPEKTFTGAALGAAALGGPLAFLGADEGVPLDSMRAELLDHQKKKMRERLAMSQALQGDY